MVQDYKVSIGVPVYNVERYIQVCAESLFKQTYKNIEYVFVDDCTPDNSIQEILEIIKKYPDRAEQVKIIRNKLNSGVSYSRNVALLNMTGEYIVWVDPDDYVEPNMIELLVKEQYKTGADIVTCGTFVHERNGEVKIIEASPFKSPKNMCVDLLSKKIPVSLWARLIRRKLHTEHNIYTKPGINCGEDFQVMPLLAFFSTRVSNVSIPLYHYNKTNINAYTYKFAENKCNQVYESFTILREFFAKNKPEYIDIIDKTLLSELCLQIFNCCLNNNYGYYKVLKHRIHKLDNKYSTELPVKDKILIILNPYIITNVYVYIRFCFQKCLRLVKMS